jgi:hypothetical protein
MGEAKRRTNQRQTFLALHPDCIYCDGRATTSDHCPPRVFFSRRQWPETYEFPACQPCNASARLDEQALAVLTRSQLTMTGKDADRVEWEALVQGVKNNQPHVIAEWMDLSRNEIKRGLRCAFGAEGDELRRQGWGLLNFGPLTQAMMTRFMLKLGKSLYYRHNDHVFDGVMYVYQIDCLSPETTPKYFADILSKAPALSKVERNRKSLVDQFVYRFNHSPEHRVLYAVVQFNEQFVFQAIAISREMDAQLTASLPRDGTVMPEGLRHECFLSTASRQPAS